MNPILNVILSFNFIILGFIGLLIMLNIQGNPKNHPHIKGLKSIHRILGYIFLVLLIFMMVMMTGKISSGSFEATPRIALHIMLSFMVVPIILIKILIARYFKKLYSFLVTFGLLVFIISFTLVMITSVPYILQSSSIKTSSEANENPIAKTFEDKRIPAVLNVEELLNSKCSVCHTLDRVHEASKTKEEWEKTIKKMIKYSQNPNYLSNGKIKSLIAYLLVGKGC